MTISFNDFVHSLHYEDIPDETLYDELGTAERLDRFSDLVTGNPRL